MAVGGRVGCWTVLPQPLAARRLGVGCSALLALYSLPHIDLIGAESQSFIQSDDSKILG